MVEGGKIDWACHSNDAATAFHEVMDMDCLLYTSKRATEAGLLVSEYVRQAVVSAEVTPRLNRQDADLSLIHISTAHDYHYA